VCNRTYNKSVENWTCIHIFSDNWSKFSVGRGYFFVYCESPAFPGVRCYYPKFGGTKLVVPLVMLSICCRVPINVENFGHLIPTHFLPLGESEEGWNSDDISAYMTNNELA
jgi:hypothetical protein